MIKKEKAVSMLLKLAYRTSGIFVACAIFGILQISSDYAIIASQIIACLVIASLSTYFNRIVADFYRYISVGTIGIATVLSLPIIALTFWAYIPLELLVLAKSINLFYPIFNHLSFVNALKAGLVMSLYYVISFFLFAKSSN